MPLDHYAVVIGIQAYPGLTPLAGPCADARAFRDWLVDPTGGDVPPPNVHLLLTSDFHPPGPASVADAKPVVDQFNAVVGDFVNRAALGQRIGERLYLYLAGHGFSDESDTNSAALIAANAEKTGFLHHITATEYADWFHRNAAFDEIVLVMDCCRDVGITHAIQNPALPKTSNPVAAKGVREFQAFATQWGASSREKDFNGQVRGIFTVTLIDALRRAASDANGCVTGSCIKDFVHGHMKEVAAPVEVDPPKIDADSAAEIVFARRAGAAKRHIRVRVTNHVAGVLVIIEGGPGPAVPPAVAMTPVVEFNLPPGIYKVRLAGSGTFKLFEVLDDADIEV